MSKFRVILILVLVLLLTLGGEGKLLAQMKVGDNVRNVQSSALVELESTKKGLLLSRLSDTAAIDALNPPNGMVIYFNNGNHQGMMVRRYNHWVDVVTSDSVSAYIQSLAKSITSASPVITVQNGIGATLQSVIVNLNTYALGHLFINGNLNDSLAVALTTGSAYDTLLNVISRNSVNSINASNGLSKASGNNIVLGGTLTQPTAIAASATNTLAVTGLQDGDITKDSLVIAEAGTGILKKVAANSLTDEEKVTYVATAGQSDFATPLTITNKFKVNVYRNGVNVEFSQVDTNHIRLILEDANDKCFAGDEVKIIQSF